MNFETKLTYLIPDNITAKDVVSAIRKIDNKELHSAGYDPKRHSDDYDLYFEKKYYPPKVVVSFANISANNIELSSKQFHAGDESNNYLINRGFPIEVKKKLNPDNFFTVEELRFFKQYANQPYSDTSRIHWNAAEFISNTVWKKSRDWGELICKSAPFYIEGKRQWNERNGRNGQEFKRYSWYSLYHNEVSAPKIYYTVGVGGEEKILVIKLDCQREGLNALQKGQIDKVDQYLQEKGVDWLTFKEAEVAQLNWDKLLKASLKYIQSTFDVYKELIALVSTDVKEMCARLCWNYDNWIGPTGIPGKSKTIMPNGELPFEGKNAFALEEWLFDMDKIIDGYHYGRIEPLYTQSGNHIGKTYHLTLFSNNSEEKQWYWVGRIENAKVLTPEESETII